MSTSAFKTVTMQIPEEISGDVQRQVVAFIQKRKADITAELEALKETEKALKLESAKAAGSNGGIVKRSSKLVAKDRILDLLKAGIGFQIGDLAEQVESSYGTTYRAAEELIKEGKVTKNTDGFVYLAQEVMEVAP